MRNRFEVPQAVLSVPISERFFELQFELSEPLGFLTKDVRAAFLRAPNSCCATITKICSLGPFRG